MGCPPSTIAHCAGSQHHTTLPPSPPPCLRRESPSGLCGSRIWPASTVSAVSWSYVGTLCNEI
ncbi:hypothetical protein B0H19DRAFT_1156033 [Mycena capillaripes]|nr:hypothetical protein B0H19DRAFT_1156033 [Mycena capillaripes]